MSGMEDGNVLTGFEMLIQNIVKENKIKQCLIKQTQLKAAELKKEFTEKKDKINKTENQIEHNIRVNKQLSQSLMLRESNVDRLREHMRILEEQEMSVRQQIAIKQQEKQLRRMKLEKLFEEVKLVKGEFVSSFATINLNKSIMMREGESEECSKPDTNSAGERCDDDRFNNMCLEESQCDIENVLSSTRKDDNREITTIERSADKSFCETSTISEDTKLEPADCDRTDSLISNTAPHKDDATEKMEKDCQLKNDEQNTCKKEELDQIKPISNNITVVPPSTQHDLSCSQPPVQLKNEPIDETSSLYMEASSIIEDTQHDKSMPAIVGTVKNEKDPYIDADITISVPKHSSRENKVKPMMSSTPREPKTITKVVSPPYYTQKSTDIHTATHDRSLSRKTSALQPIDENTSFILNMNSSPRAKSGSSSPGFDFELSEENNQSEEPAGDFLSNLFGGMETEQTEERDSEFNMFF